MRALLALSLFACQSSVLTGGPNDGVGPGASTQVPAPGEPGGDLPVPGPVTPGAPARPLLGVADSGAGPFDAASPTFLPRGARALLSPRGFVGRFVGFRGAGSGVSAVGGEGPAGP